jgi:serine/threonine-protein kinase
MGEIYRGHVVETGDPVAIKMMRLDLADNAMALALFRKEASALHNIHHEAIIRYYVFSHDPGVGRHYLAMEFVDGMPLSDLLQQGPLGLNSVRLLQERLALGLNAAHQHGIIHRDLSPDNVLIPGHDLAQAKVIDFGIARSTRSGDGTIIGSAFAGKYNYVSPEQLGLFGGDVSARSDIYSLGLVLAACLLGRPLDMGGTQLEVLEKRRTVPDLTAIDKRFRPLLNKMLQPDPARRPDSMAAVAAWRPEAARSRSEAAAPRSGARPAAPGAGRRRSTIAAVLLLLLLGLGGGFYVAKDPIAALVVALSGTAQSPPPLPPQPPRPADLRERVLDFVNAYDGGDCFFITLEAMGEGKAGIDGLGAAADPFELLFNGFSGEFRSTNVEAAIGWHQVTPEQCPAVNFLYQTRRQRDAAPRLDVEAAGLKDGVVKGSMSGIGDGKVYLLAVADDGYVTNADAAITSSGATRTFEFRIEKGRAGSWPQLVVAVASSMPLESLKLPPAGRPSGQVFPRLLAEAGQTLRVRAKYFLQTR